MWYPDANGNPQEIPAFGSWTGGSDYPVHLFTEYMTQALADTPNETFPTATDSGKVGGSDGTWGTGAQKSYTSQTTPKAEESTQPTTPSPTETTTPDSGSGSGSGDGDVDSGSGDNGGSGSSTDQSSQGQSDQGQSTQSPQQ